jgi:hypothetical protein
MENTQEKRTVAMVQKTKISSKRENLHRERDADSLPEQADFQTRDRTQQICQWNCIHPSLAVGISVQVLKELLKNSFITGRSFSWKKSK